MRLNAQTDFSLRILMYLAAKQGEAATIQEVTNKLGLSQAHLMRIAAKLSATGLVTAARGRSGGLKLARSADEITVEDVVKAIEPDFALVQCFNRTDGVGCTIEPACLLKGVLYSALNAFFAELRSANLAELTESNRVDLAEIFRLTDSRLESRTGPQIYQVPAQVKRS